MVFVSMGLRMKVEVEALNMVEALGAYSRHRTVSLLKKFSKDGKVKYKIITAPAISGQSIANGYQRVIVELAQRSNLPVCDECKSYERRGGFDKRSTLQISHDDRVRGCIVEDLTGFMAPGVGERRTSPVQFSYLVPDIESADVALDPQFHVKYNFEVRVHRPFTIESATAMYMLSIAIDVERIGKLLEGGYVNDRCKRIKLALEAISVLIEGLEYGAKKARYLPILNVVGGIAAVSDPIPFMVSPPRVSSTGRNYIEDTIQRANTYKEVLKDYKEQIKIILMDKEGLVNLEDVKPKEGGKKETDIEIIRVSTLSDMISKTIEEVRNFVKCQENGGK